MKTVGPIVPLRNCTEILIYCDTVGSSQGLSRNLHIKHWGTKNAFHCCRNIIQNPKLWTCSNVYIRGFTKFGIKVLWRLQFLEYLRTLHLKFQKARTKIEVVLSLPCWLSQLNWDSQQGRTTSILVQAFWNFKRKILKYSRNCSLHNTLIPNFGCLEICA